MIVIQSVDLFWQVCRFSTGCIQAVLNEVGIRWAGKGGMKSEERMSTYVMYFKYLWERWAARGWDAFPTPLDLLDESRYIFVTGEIAQQFCYGIALYQSGCVNNAIVLEL